MKEPAPILDKLNLVVRDMEATLTFYRRLGVEIPEPNVWRTESGDHHAQAAMSDGFDLDFDSESFANRWNMGWNGPAANRAIIGFSLASREAVDERFADLVEAGYAGLQSPYDAFWGARYAVVEDPDKNHIGLMSPIDPARKGPPPAV